MGLSEPAARAVSSFLKVSALASLTAAGYLSAAWLLDGDTSGAQRGPVDFIFGLFFAAAVCFPFVVVGGLLFGLPIHLFLARTGKVTLSTYLIAGVLGGGLAGALILGAFLGTGSVFARAAGLGAVAGIVSSALWWKLQVARPAGPKNA